MTFHVPERYRVRLSKEHPLFSDESFGNNGLFFIGRLHIKCIASDGAGWEHVSASLQTRAPRWSEMCKIKDLFWDAEDCVVQYHPPKSVYVNCHPHTLHLWRPVDQTIIMPPSILVGPKS